MILPEKKIVLVHVPKTSGTFLEKWLLPYSDSEIVTGGWRDREERFELQGKYTRHRHMTVDQYQEVLPREVFARMRVLSAVRHPVQRSVSFYFSPHRWVVKKRSVRLRSRLMGWIDRDFPEKPSDFTTARPKFSLKEFEEVMVHVPSMTSYLMEGGEFRFPGYLIRHETFEADCIRFMDEIGLQPPDLFRKVNRSAASDERIKECISDKRVVDLVLRLHREDFENFEY